MKLKEYTSTTTFVTAFEDIMQNHADEYEKRAAAVEEFFITEARKAGVIKISKSHKYKNPNRLEKQLAPWFSEECAIARSTYKHTKKQLGRLHEHT